MLVGLATALAVGPTLSTVGLAAKQAKGADDLTRIYVFYSEPPFAYELRGEVRVRASTLWDRDKKELAIRKEVARAGGDVVIVDRSFLEWDGVVQDVGTPGPRGIARSIEVPTRSAYVAGRIGTRIENDPAGGHARVYPARFDAVWASVTRTAAALGWRLDKVDGESRYMTTLPVPTAAATMRCEVAATDWLPATFRVHVNSVAENSAVRLDVTFVDRTTGVPSECRSVGVYEAAFFGRLERALAGE